MRTSVEMSVMEFLQSTSELLITKNSYVFFFQALDTLSIVAPLCLDDYMTCQSNTRLLMLLEWCVGEGKHCLIFSFVCILLQSF